MPSPKPGHLRKPMDWHSRAAVARTLHGLPVHTICREARCPNIGDCSSRREASFLILGRLCTRHCRFCNVEKTTPIPPDPAEPMQVAEAIRRLGLAYAVITSPTRDDLPDGGASHFAATVSAIRQVNLGTQVELLIPDFQDNRQAIKTAAHCGAIVVGHNVETVPSLYHVRLGADYQRSLRVLKALKEENPALITKSALLLGLGETAEELHRVFQDLRAAGVDLLSLGQYLAPSHSHAPVVRYLDPSEFESLKKTALSLGFKAVESGPFVRSSYRAAGMAAQLTVKES